MSDPIMQFFRSSHLPNDLQDVALPFESVAKFVVATLPRNPERTACLRKLLEAKDCAVRTKLFRELPA